jgi:2-polyprenyl-3-methyl-5-hydroxy-6-metoxy-1,4-benzoquinol methylase
VDDAASKHMYTVLTGSFAEMHSLLPDKYFDVVICNNVIEHMENEEEFFYIIKKMRDEGYLVASIPNVRH